MCILKAKPIEGVDEIFAYKLMRRRTLASDKQVYLPYYVLSTRYDARVYELGKRYQATGDPTSKGFHALHRDFALAWWRDAHCNWSVFRIVLVKLEHTLVTSLDVAGFGKAECRGEFQTILKDVTPTKP